MTDASKRTYLLAGFFIALGLGIFYIKVSWLDYPVLAQDRTQLWDFEIFLDFMGRNEPARLEVFIPTRQADRGIFGEQFYSGAFGLTLTEETGGNRRAVWTYRYPDNRKVLRYRARVASETIRTPIAEISSTASEPDIIIGDEVVRRQAFIVWRSALRRRSADDESFAALTLRSIFSPGSDATDAVEALLPSLPAPLARLELARMTLREEGISARIANGIALTESRRRAPFIHWLEYELNGESRRYFVDETPDRFFTIWYGTRPFLADRGVSELDVQISLKSIWQTSLGTATDLPRSSASEASIAGFASQIGFQDLPVTTQLVYRVLVTVPIGIMLLVFLRQFIGISTLGTFMPVLIGMAFRETALVNGILLFTALTALGLWLRFTLERLQLLLVPRLATVLVFIVICMSIGSMGFSSFNQSIGLSVSLFPMVILTMTIERMSIVWEEYDALTAIREGAGSIFVAALSYAVMTQENVSYLMYQFPELLLVVMALCMLMGRYTGLRLTEIARFWSLRKASAS